MNQGIQFRTIELGTQAILRYDKIELGIISSQMTASGVQIWLKDSYYSVLSYRKMMSSSAERNLPRSVSASADFYAG